MPSAAGPPTSYVKLDTFLDAIGVVALEGYAEDIWQAGGTCRGAADNVYLTEATVNIPHGSQQRRRLHWAANEGKPELVERLLRCGADVAAWSLSQGQYGWYGRSPAVRDSSALHYATCRCPYPTNTECVRLLCAAGADVNACDRYYATPLMLACRGRIPTWELRSSIYGGPAMPAAESALVASSRAATVQALLAAGASQGGSPTWHSLRKLPDQKGTAFMYPLELACMLWNEALAAALIGALPQPIPAAAGGPQLYQLALHTLVTSLYVDGDAGTATRMVNKLLDAGAQVEGVDADKHVTPLAATLTAAAIAANVWRHAHTAQLTAKYRTEGITGVAAHTAAVAAVAEERSGWDGSQPLLAPAFALLARGANPNVTTADGKHALLAAINCGSVVLFHALGGPAACAAVPAKQRCELLEAAVSSGSARLLGLLLDSDAGAGLDVNARFGDAHGHTPLLRAVLDQNPVMVVELLARGADASKRSGRSYGTTPTEAAAHTGCPFIAGALCAHPSVNPQHALVAAAACGLHGVVSELLYGRSCSSSDGDRDRDRDGAGAGDGYGAGCVCRSLKELSHMLYGGNSDSSSGDTAAATATAATAETAAEGVQVKVEWSEWSEADAAADTESSSAPAFECRVDVNLVDRVGNTPFDWACANGHEACGGLLARHPSLHCSPALVAAAGAGWLSVVRSLLSRDADVNYVRESSDGAGSGTGDGGTTAVAAAAAGGHGEVVAELVRWGAPHVPVATTPAPKHIEKGSERPSEDEAVRAEVYRKFDWGLYQSPFWKSDLASRRGWDARARY